MKQTTKGIKRASGMTRKGTPFTFTVWFDEKRNRVFTTTDNMEVWYNDYELLGYVKLFVGSRHYTMREIAQRIDEYYSMVLTWYRGLH